MTSIPLHFETKIEIIGGIKMHVSRLFHHGKKVGESRVDWSIVLTNPGSVVEEQRNLKKAYCDYLATL